MKTLLNTEPGYIWYDGKLQSYQFVKADITLHGEEQHIETHCIIGGVPTILDKDDLVYASEKAYQDATEIPHTIVDWYSHRAIDSKGRAWILTMTPSNG